MLQAATITQALHNAGIACASGLCVPSGNDWKDFLPKIDSRFSKCEVLILLLSPAFYRSQPCLLEIHKAAKAKRMVMIPLRCADAESLPSKVDQWPDIDKKDVLVLDQVQDKLGPINALPPRGCFFDAPNYLDDLVGRVRGGIAAAAAAAAAAEAGVGALTEAAAHSARAEVEGEAEASSTPAPPKVAYHPNVRCRRGDGCTCGAGPVIVGPMYRVGEVCVCEGAAS